MKQIKLILLFLLAGIACTHAYVSTECKDVKKAISHSESIQNYVILMNSDNDYACAYKRNAQGIEEGIMIKKTYAGKFQVLIVFLHQGETTIVVNSSGIFNERDKAYVIISVDAYGIETWRSMSESTAHYMRKKAQQALYELLE